MSHKYTSPFKIVLTAINPETQTPYALTVRVSHVVAYNRSVVKKDRTILYLTSAVFEVQQTPDEIDALLY